MEINTKKLKPMDDGVLIKMEPVTDKVCESGIVIPEAQVQRYERARRAKIISVGPEAHLENTKCKCRPGDTVLIGASVGEPIEINGDIYKIVGHRYILAKITKEPK
ncbi:MAG: co-chaperone GroES family protein [Planctomycetota bacterium]